MKKIAVIVLSLALVLTMAACAGKQVPVTEPASSGGSTTQPSTGDTTPSASQGGENETEDPLEWGITDQFAAETKESIKSYYINLPHYAGALHGRARGGEQLDGTVVLISGQHDEAPEISSTSELFPAYFDQLQSSLESYYGLRSSNYELSLQDTASTTIGDYEMSIFTGTIAFDYDWQNEVSRREYQFVSYATTLKSNGGYAFWVVYDETEDQSNGDLIAQHALNMAKTFREER